MKQIPLDLKEQCDTPLEAIKIISQGLDRNEDVLFDAMADRERRLKAQLEEEVAWHT